MAPTTWFITPTASETLGPELTTAVHEDNLPKVQKLKTSSHTCTWTDILTLAASSGSTTVAAYSLSSGAKVNDFVLGQIIGSPHSEPVYRLLVETGAVDVNFEVDRRGLMLGNAVKYARHSMIKYILDKGANPNSLVETQNDDCNLAVAARWGDEQTLVLLLDHGATIQGSGALVRAAEGGKVENMRILLERGADVNELGVVKTFDRRSMEKLGAPLHKAVGKKQFDAIDLLLEAGASVSVLDAKGRTAADVARAQGMSTEIVAKLEPKDKISG